MPDSVNNSEKLLFPFIPFSTFLLLYFYFGNHCFSKNRGSPKSISEFRDEPSFFNGGERILFSKKKEVFNEVGGPNFGGNR